MDLIDQRVAEAKSELIKHGLIEWSVQLNRALTCSGYCDNKAKAISLSRVYLKVATIEQFKNTVLHEIAHALTPGTKHHGKAWREKAKEIGCNGKRTCKSFTKGKYVITCKSKCTVVRRHRVNRSYYEKRRCKKCKLGFTIKKKKCTE